MNRIVLLGAGCALLGIAGCGPATVESLVVDSLSTKSMAMRTNASGEATDVVDRSVSNNQVMTITQREINGFPHDASVTVSGSMFGGTTVPGDDGMAVLAGSTSDYIPSYRNNDSFLTEVHEGAYYATAKYETRLGDRKYVAYGATRGGETLNMPTNGVAHYNGSVHGTVFGSQTGESALSGNVSMAANFGPGLSTMSGKMTNLRLIQGSDNYALGSDIVMNAAPINGNGYSGSLYLDRAGVSTFGSYDGSFYGPGARETAGTFQFDADGVPIPGPAPAYERLQGVGAFGAN